jgi:HEAT repeat protein
MNLGPSAASAIPVLVEILREPVNDPLKVWNSHGLAQKALAYIGPSAVPALIELIRDREPLEDVEARYHRLKARYDGLWALGWIDVKHVDEQALALVREVATDPDEHIWLRAHAAGYLSRRYARTSAYLAVLAEAARPSATGWEEVSRLASVALAGYAGEATMISGLMIEILESDASDYVKQEAIKTLATLGCPSSSVVATLRALRDGQGSSVRHAAANALEHWGIDTQEDDA